MNFMVEKAEKAPGKKLEGFRVSPFPEIERHLPQGDLPQDKCSKTFALKGQLPQVTWTFAPKTDDQENLKSTTNF